MHSKTLCLVMASVLTVTLWSGTARADLNNEVHNGVKGAVGLGLLGADITLIIEGAARVRNPWLLSIIPIVVAGGGAAGGYFMGRASAEAAVATLVSGLALIIPAAIMVAYGRSYRPANDEEEGFVDRTEEGAPYDLGDEMDEPLDGETETEVIGPNDSDEVPPPAEEPAPGQEPAPIEGGETGTAPIGPLFAQVELTGRLPVGGMVRVMADQRSQGPQFRLSLTVF